MSSYNSTLQANNIDLQAILNTINELPEAGNSSGGGSVETCTVDLAPPAEFELQCIAYSDGTRAMIWQPTPLNVFDRINLEVAKNSALCMLLNKFGSGDYLIEGDAEVLHNYGSTAVFGIYGDCSIDVTNIIM